MKKRARRELYRLCARELKNQRRAGRVTHSKKPHLVRAYATDKTVALAAIRGAFFAADESMHEDQYELFVVLERGEAFL